MRLEKGRHWHGPWVDGKPGAPVLVCEGTGTVLGGAVVLRVNAPRRSRAGRLLFALSQVEHDVTL